MRSLSLHEMHVKAAGGVPECPKSSRWLHCDPATLAVTIGDKEGSGIMATARGREPMKGSCRRAGPAQLMNVENRASPWRFYTQSFLCCLQDGGLLQSKSLPLLASLSDDLANHFSMFCATVNVAMQPHDSFPCSRHLIEISFLGQHKYPLFCYSRTTVNAKSSLGLSG